MKTNFSYFIFSIILFISGCASTITDYEKTSRDEEKYKSPVVTAKDYKALPYVLETRGSGELAFINIGSSDGLKKNSKIVFFKIIQSMNKRYQLPFAEGRVFQLDEHTAWIKVKNYKSANIKINQFAKLATDQNYTFGEKMAFPPRFWSKE